MSDPIPRLNAALEGRYRIEREIGEGGMATVYLADDFRHDRQVAVKVLKPELAAVVGADRFLAEIKTTAGLQHPHILPLHDSGEADGFLFYVMPYVAGETLRDRLDREGQLPVEEATRLATAVAGALQAAHDAGVVHRDIKPGNILLSRGEPLVADFGIALAVGAAGGNRLTETGLSLGTPHYMSPEQATGNQTIGPASDVYALACVLYEMLVGEPPYTGSTAQVILGRIISGDAPSAAEERASIPPNVDAAIRKGLEKLPADRFGSARKMARALADTSFRWGERAGAGPGAGSNLWTPLSIGTTAAALLFAAAFLWAVVSSPGPEDTPARQSSILLPEDVELDVSPGPALAISPDGSRIVYRASSGSGDAELRTRSLAPGGADVPIAGSRGAGGFFLSPDGESVAFSHDAEGTLKVVPVDGGVPVTIARTGVDGGSAFYGGAWGEDGSIVFSTSTTGLRRTPVSGGEVEELTTAGRSAADLHHHPGFLPDGSGLVFSVSTVIEAADRDFRIAVLPFGDSVHELVEGHSPTVTEDGVLIFSRGLLADEELWAARLGGDWTSLATDPVRVLTGGPEGFELAAPRTQYAIDRDGSLIYLPVGTRGATERRLVWIDRAGRTDPILSRSQVPNATAGMIAARLSPDGTRIAFRSNLSSPGRNFGLFVWDLERGGLTAIPGDENADWPVWWGNDRLVFNRFSEDGQALYWTRADGTGTPQPLIPDELALQQHPQQLIPDGSGLLVQRRPVRSDPDSDIWLLPLEGEGEARPIVDDPGTATQPALDPTGRWLAYTSDISGTREVYVTEYPDSRTQTRVSPDGGNSPVWNPAGGELFYRRGGEIWSAEVSVDPTFRVHDQALLFEDRFSDVSVTGSWGRTFDVSSDGERLLAVEIIETDAPAAVPRLTLVQGWLGEVESRLERR